MAKEFKIKLNIDNMSVAPSRTIGIIFEDALEASKVQTRDGKVLEYQKGISVKSGIISYMKNISDDIIYLDEITTGSILKTLE